MERILIRAVNRQNSFRFPVRMSFTRFTTPLTSAVSHSVRKEVNRVNRRTDETYGGRAKRDMETEVGPVTVPFTSLFMNGPGLSPLVTSVVRDRLTTFPLPFTP